MNNLGHNLHYNDITIYDITIYEKKKERKKKKKEKEAEEFWRLGDGIGNPGAPWLKEIEEVMASCIRENSDNTGSMIIKEQQITQAIN